MELGSNVYTSCATCIKLGTEHVQWLIVNLVQLPLSSLAVLSIFIAALLQFAVGHLHIMLMMFVISVQCRNSLYWLM